MVSIRLRIFFLALIALAAVITAFYIQYRDIEEKLSSAENAVEVFNVLHPVSELIHSLQKERGLSAGKMLGHDEVLESMFMKQREITNAKWAALIKANILDKHEIDDNFLINLKAIRERMDSELIEWPELRDFYSSNVQNILEVMLLKFTTLNNTSEMTYNPRSLSYMASARESLGLIRATLNRIYLSDQALLQDLMFINHHYLRFKNNLKSFEAIHTTGSIENNNTVLLTKIRNEVFDSVIVQIEETLNSEGKSLSGSSSLWWREATLVIDTMKKVEETILDQNELDSLEQMEYYKNFIYWYGLFAFLILVSVTLVTVLTVHRVLKALFILLKSLDNVQQTQDYGLRIPGHSRDEFGQLCYSINSLLSFTDNILKDKELLATTDLLTNVMNRRSFTAVAEKEIIRSERYKKPLSIIYCDIDFFKLVNDNHGHAIGDEVLKKFAETIKSNLRSTDYFARWGGEEFIIMALETELSDALKLAEMLRQEIMSLSIDPIENLTSSFGVAQKQEGESFVALCERADKALYQAKDTGRNKACSASS